MIDYTTAGDGYAWERTLPEGVHLTQPINTAGHVTGATLQAAGESYSVSFALSEGVRPSSMTRPGGSTSYQYNLSKELTNINHGSGSRARVSLGRDSVGRVETRSLPHLGVTDTFGHNHAGWITSEERNDGSLDAEYEYREDGIRTSHTINGRKTRFVASDAGRMQEVWDGHLSPQYQAAVSGEIYWVDPNPAYPNPANTYYASVDAAIQAVFAEHGPQPPTDPPIIYIAAPNPYPADIIIEQTGVMGDDFEDGAGGAWDSTVTSGNGTVDFQQTAIARSGFAPKFTAGSGDEAYVTKTFASPPDTFSQTVHLYLDAEDLDDQDDEALLLRVTDGVDSLIELKLIYDGQPELEALHYDGAGLVSAGTSAVAEDGWYQVDLVFSPDHGDADDGRFRWWVNGSFVGATTDMDLPSLVFNDLALGLISVTDCSLELITDDCGIGGLTTNATNPIIIRSKRGTDLRVTGNVEVRSVSHVRLQGLELEGATVRFENATGCGLASCIVETSVVFENCSDPDVYNNTFDCQSGANSLELQNCGGGLVWNNIFYENSAGNPGVSWTGGAPSLGYNCYWPNNCPWSEPGSTYGDPLLHATQYHITSGSSVAMSAGEPQFSGPSSLYEDGVSTKVYDGDVPEDTQDPLDNFSVPEGSGGRQGSLYYHDDNANQGYDTGEDLWHDLNGNGIYDDATDAKVYGGGDGYQVADQDPGEQKGLFYHDADGDGDWDAGESIYVSTSNMVGYVCADFYGRRRRTHPCQGAIERHTESVESSCGRVTARVIDGRRTR